MINNFGKISIALVFLTTLLGCSDNKSSFSEAPRYNSRPERARLTPSYTSDCKSGHWIASVNRDGEIIVLEDGSVWLVDLIDQIESMLWLPTSDIVACYDKLINIDDGETVSARRIR